MIYFDKDGSYGDADGLIIVDTSKWTQQRPMSVCECEHENHFNGESHDYGVEVQDTQTVNSSAGPFNMCADCVTAHIWDGYSQEWSL